MNPEKLDAILAYIGQMTRESWLVTAEEAAYVLAFMESKPQQTEEWQRVKRAVGAFLGWRSELEGVYPKDAPDNAGPMGLAEEAL